MSENKNKDLIQITIEEEMKGAYLDYAMSVIVGRALPDVRDGLKPVHRRVLYAMYKLRNSFDKPYKKSARIVGDVIGKYHPHGDTAVYDALVRMAQDFSLLHPLIDGQGNFGSVDGDAPAAMRYTEVRMAKITEELLADIDQETVDFHPNYDESLEEPDVLPSKIPNLLINGSSGIAVGMATNIPPHRLSEVIDATIALIDQPNLDSHALLQYIQGPDFPTGAFTFDGPGLKQAYQTGRGTIILRGKVEIEVEKNDRQRIVITELPYQVNKARLVEKIADLVRNKKLEGISDLRDESDRSGMRVVIEVKKGENANIILNKLYKLTSLQDSYGFNLIAIHQNRPRIFNLRDLIWTFIEHRKDIVTRRTSYNLKKAQAKIHILEGLKKALENINEVITLLKNSKDTTSAKQELIHRLQLSENQAQAILELRLQRLTHLERNKIFEEIKKTFELIQELKKLLGSEALIYELIKKELSEIKERYDVPRKTKIIQGTANHFEVEDLIADEVALVSITHAGYIKRTELNQFKSQHRGGKGIKGVNHAVDDLVTNIYQCTILSTLLCFTNRGKVYGLKVYQIPESGRVSKGKAIINLLPLLPHEKIKAILPIKEFHEDEYVILVTKAGIIKKTSLSEFRNIRSSGIAAISIQDQDELVSAKITDGKNEIFICTQNARSIRFEERNVRSMGRTASGVIGIHLEEDDQVVAMEVLHPQLEGEFEILTITENGYGKRTPIKEYRVQSRSGTGVKNMKVNEKNGKVVGSRCVLPKDDVILVSNKGQMIRIHVGEISTQSRHTQGVRLIALTPPEKVVAFEYLVEEVHESLNEN